MSNKRTKADLFAGQIQRDVLADPAEVGSARERPAFTAYPDDAGDAVLITLTDPDRKVIGRIRSGEDMSGDDLVWVYYGDGNPTGQITSTLVSPDQVEVML